MWLLSRRKRRRGPTERPAVLLVPDRPGWAFDFLADDLIRFGSERYAFTKYYKHHMPEEDYRRFDAVYFFWWAKGSIESARRLRIPRRRCMTVISSYSSWMKRGWTDRELKEILSFYGAVGAVCRGLYERFRPLHRHVFLTRHGVDVSRFTEVTPIPERREKGRLVVGWAGSLRHDEAEKGVRKFIEPAVAAVEGAELRLALGDDSEHPCGRSYAREEMPAFYNEIDVYLCASRTEGGPLPVLEAGACGRPVVSTPVGIVPELVRDGENGFLVERRVEAIADALRRLRDDRALLRRAGARNREVVVSEWTWGRRIGEYFRMFDYVIGRA